MLRLALVCALVAVGLSAPAVPKSWTGHLSNLLVDSTAYNSADGVTTTNCQCNGCGGPDHPSTTASERTNRHYTEADPAVWGHTSQAYSNDPAKGCAAACFRNETDNHAGTPSEAHSYPNTRASTSHKGCKVSLYNSETNRCFLYDHGMTSVTNQGASKFTCWASQHECHSNANCQHHNPTPVPSLSPTPSPTPSPTAPTPAPTNACTMSTLAENNFNNRGDSSLSTSTTYQYTLSAGYTCKLSGWTHTRNYHMGFLRNTAGSGQAEVSGLVAGQTYQWRIYQFASSFAWSSTNAITANGVSKGTTSSTTNTNGGPTLTGTSTADSNGKITFVFTRTNHHTALSGIAMCPA